MSFKIFSLQLLGKIKPVEIIEIQREKLQIDFDEFQEVEKSDELKKYLELEELINSAAFKSKKAEIKGLHFKGSREFNQLREFNRLKKALNIKRYFKIANSNDLGKFDDLKEADKLNEYYKLVEYVKEGQFQKEKREIKSQVFKGSVEEKHWLEFKKLNKSPGIKAYLELNGSEVLKKHEAFANSEKLKGFVTLRNAPDKDKQKRKECKMLRRDSEIKAYFRYEKSKKLKFYRETVGSHDLKKYSELKDYIEKEDYKKREVFLKDKKKFEKSEAYKKYKKYKQLASDEEVKFVLKFERSSLYKNYLDVKDSFDLKRYFELDKIIKSQEFIDRKAYLEDKKKWEKSDEFAKQQEFLKMKELPQFVKYFKYKGTADFDFLKNWELTFEDDFSASKLDSEKWSNVSFIAEKLLGDNYSMPGDLHVFANGKNIKTGGGLTLSVKKETSAGKVWQMPAGFVPVEFDYSSDLVSTGKSFWQNDGIFEAKIKFSPCKQIVSSFYLAGENNTPRINMLEMGTKNRLGISTLTESGKVNSKGFDISNLKQGKSYIFAIEKLGSSLTWKINETEVGSVQDSTINFPLHLNASSIVVYDVPDSKLPIDFEIDWVKCYHKK
ncbi:MAG: hypothetical protein L3J54_10165 [Draconibacterium sp.]|nr:hypothetical protein [Draconibacterium sp.]